MWSFRELKLNTLLNDASAINRKRKYRTVLLMHFLFLHLLLCLQLSNTNEEK